MHVCVRVPAGLGWSCRHQRLTPASVTVLTSMDNETWTRRGGCKVADGTTTESQVMLDIARARFIKLEMAGYSGGDRFHAISMLKVFQQLRPRARDDVGEDFRAAAEVRRYPRAVQSMLVAGLTTCTYTVTLCPPAGP